MSNFHRDVFTKKRKYNKITIKTFTIIVHCKLNSNILIYLPHWQFLERSNKLAKIGTSNLTSTY